MKNIETWCTFKVSVTTFVKTWAHISIEVVMLFSLIVSENVVPTFWNGLTNPDYASCDNFDECAATVDIIWSDRTNFIRLDFMEGEVRFDQEQQCSKTFRDAYDKFWLADDPYSCQDEEHDFVCQWECEDVTTTVSTTTAGSSTVAPTASTTMAGQNSGKCTSPL